jgi:lipopolysaccharide transport system permease protein
MGEALFDSLFRAALTAVLFAAYGIVPSWGIVLVPVMLAPLVLLTVGIGFVGALMNAVVRDVASFLTLILTFAMFLSPVVYPPPSRWPTSLINYLNPVSPFVIAARDLAVSGTLSQPLGLLGGTVAAVVAFLIGWRVFHLGLPRIIERV